MTANTLLSLASISSERSINVPYKHQSDLDQPSQHARSARYGLTLDLGDWTVGDWIHQCEGVVSSASRFPVVNEIDATIEPGLLHQMNPYT